MTTCSAPAPIDPLLPPWHAQRLEVARRAWLKLDLDLPRTGACGADEPPVWTVCPEDPDLLLGAWSVGIERSHPGGATYQEEALTIEVAFSPGTAWLICVTSVLESTGLPLGHWPNGFVAGEQARAIETERQTLRDAVMPTVDPSAVTTAPPPVLATPPRRSRL